MNNYEIINTYNQKQFDEVCDKYSKICDNVYKSPLNGHLEFRCGRVLIAVVNKYFA